MDVNACVTPETIELIKPLIKDLVIGLFLAILVARWLS